MAAIVDNLLRAKRAAAVLAEDDRKATALPMEVFFAGMTGDTEAVFEWLNRGGDINAGEEVTQATLLIAAAVTGATLHLEVLIAKGAAIDRRDSHGQTALTFAALYGHAAILSQLATAGAALHLVCQAGLTAEQHAARAGHWECVRELRGLDRCPPAGSSDRKRTRRSADDAWVLPEDIAAAAEQVRECGAGGGYSPCHTPTLCYNPSPCRTPSPGHKPALRHTPSPRHKPALRHTPSPRPPLTPLPPIAGQRGAGPAVAGRRRAHRRRTPAGELHAAHVHERRGARGSGR